MGKYKIIPSSRTIVRSPISIGHKAEKGVEAIEFDLTAWVETYGSGTLTVIMRRWGDAIPYPVALELDENNKATWTLSDIDTAKAGMAYAQLNYIVGDEVVKKSDIYTFRVMDSLTGEGEPPEAYESWLEHLTHLAAEAMAEVLDIEGIVTDKTLTVDGGIADAKAAGDALALKADKSTTYTKTEVDQMIEDVEVETDTTLSVSGKPADAAETGRQIGLLKADLDTVTSDEENLFWLSNTIPRTYGGVAIAFNSDGSIVLNGTGNTLISYALFGGVHQVDSILPAGKYVFGRELISGTATKNPYFCKPDGTSFLLGQEYTFDEDTAVIIRIGSSGYTFTNAVYKFSVRKVGTTANDEIAREKLKPKMIKILGIGNSYTRDSTRWLSKILTSAGYEKVIVGQAYIGTITLAEQYDNLNTANYTYYKYVTTGNRYQLENVSLNSVINDEDWDVVVFQQQSDESGQYASFVSNDFDINDFIAYVKTAISNDSLKVGLVLPWSHATGYVGDKFEEYYNSDPAVQFTAIKTVIPQVANHMSQCDFIVNVGDAVDYGRKNAYLSALGVEMLRTDKNHLQYGIPSYMAGLVYAMTICGINGTESTWYPTSADEGVECVTSANLARLARICAKNAVLAVQ